MTEVENMARLKNRAMFCYKGPWCGFAIAPLLKILYFCTTKI